MRLNVYVGSTNIRVGQHLSIQRNSEPLITQIVTAIRLVQTHGEAAQVALTFEKVLDAVPAAAVEGALNLPLYSVYNTVVVDPVTTG